jgi:hypothetical protein
MSFSNTEIFAGAVVLVFTAAVYIFAVWAMTLGIADYTRIKNTDALTEASVCVAPLRASVGGMAIISTTDVTKQAILPFEGSTTVKALQKNPEEGRVILVPSDETGVLLRSGDTGFLWINDIGESIVRGGEWNLVSLGVNAELIATIEFKNLTTKEVAGEHRIEFVGSIDGTPKLDADGVDYSNITLFWSNPEMPMATQISCRAEPSSPGGSAPLFRISVTFAESVTVVQGTGHFKVMATYNLGF